MQYEPHVEVIVKALVKAWRLDALCIFAAGTALLLAFVPRDAMAVPGRDRVFAVIWPLLPTLLAVPIPAIAEHRTDDVHRTAPRILALRLRVLATVAVLCLVGVSTGAVIGSHVLIRNTAALVGLALLGAGVLPRSVSWALLVLTPMAMWLFGTRREQDAFAWAFLLRPAADRWADAVAAVLLGGGIGAFTVGRARS